MLNLSRFSLIRALQGIFAFGVENHILRGQLAWLVLLVIAIGYNIVVRYLPRKAYGYVSQSDIVVDEERP